MDVITVVDSVGLMPPYMFTYNLRYFTTIFLTCDTRGTLQKEMRVKEESEKEERQKETYHRCLRQK